MRVRTTTAALTSPTPTTSIPVVDLVSPCDQTRNTRFQSVPLAENDEVQILTVAEAAAEMAARGTAGEANVSRKRKRVVVETKPQPTECMICREDCTSSGRHRLAALKCGHLFGKKCIERWINEKKTCPNCNTKARNADICILFSDHVTVVDNSGSAELTTKLEEVNRKSRMLENEITVLKQQLEMKTKETVRLQSELIKRKKVLAESRQKQRWC